MSFISNIAKFNLARKTDIPTALTPALLNIATRCRHQNNTSAGTLYTQMFSRTMHINRGTTTLYVQPVFSNWYASANGEFVGPGTATITASIEYPYGYYNQCQFGGVASGTVAAGANITTDPCYVGIPPGGRFWVRSYYVNAGGIVYSAGGTNAGVTDATSPGIIEVCHAWLTGGTDWTMLAGQTSSPPATGAAFYPVAILSMSTVPSVCVFGDSRCAGTGDLPASNFLLSGVGEICRSLDLGLPYTNVGCGSDEAQYWNSPLAGAGLGNLRKQLVQYHTHAHVEYGTNDLTAGAQTATQVQASLTLMHTTLSAMNGATGKPIKVSQSTISPVTTSTDAWATTTNQAVVPSNANRITVNTWIRTKPSTVWAYFEIANQVETALNSGIWKALFTADGTHETPLGYKTIQYSGAINLVLFVFA
jgi:hypothetical protein